MHINCLPNELICKIFVLAIRPQEAQTDRCKLISVCRLWREYVEGSALLWVDISSDAGWTYIRRALERSKGSVINIHYPASSSARKSLQLFMAETGSHITRWQSLTVEVLSAPPSWETALGPLTTERTPKLKSLELRLLGLGHPIPRNPITLFGGAPAPSTLKYLSLKHVQVAFEPLSLSGLTSLNLSAVSNLSTPQLLEILRNSPWLESLSLDEVFSIGSMSSAVQSIHLPRLVSLALEWIDHAGTNCILSAIRIPNRRRIYIRAAIQGVSPRSVIFTPTTSHILYTTTPIPASDSDPDSSDIVIDVDGKDGFRIEFRGMELELYGDGEDLVHDILGWLVEGLGSEAATCQVQLVIHHLNMDPAQLVAAVPPPLVVKHVSIPGSMLGSF